MRAKKLHAGWVDADKSVVAGAKDRATNRVSTLKVRNTEKRTLHEFANSRVADDSIVDTDDHRGCKRIRRHESVKHRSASMFVTTPIPTRLKAFGRS